jgi:hypothetical protein
MLASAVTVDRVNGVQPGLMPFSPNGQSYDLAILRFGDDGQLIDPQELAAVTASITNARTNPNGAVVVLFIHGWHHNDEWSRADDSGDTHFKSFRKVLRALMLREAERYFNQPHGGGRRLVGIYLGWNGHPATSWFPKGSFLNFTTFRNRYRTARRIGQGSQLRHALRAIVATTKAPLSLGTGTNATQAPESPLVLIGHSMGALMLESAFLSLLNVVTVQRAGVRVSFPDVMIALNSAADSSILSEIRHELTAQRITLCRPPESPMHLLSSSLQRPPGSTSQ